MPLLYREGAVTRPAAGRSGSLSSFTVTTVQYRLQRSVPPLLPPPPRRPGQFPTEQGLLRAARISRCPVQRGGGGAAGRAQTARGSGSYRSVQGSIGSDEEALVFDSLFECGNLDTAHRIGATEYELQLRTDNKTTGHTQWYFFAVSNAHSGATYRFHISNLNKPDSLYARGQQPLFFSTVASQQSGLGWHRIGQAISYRKNGKKRNGRPLFTLTVSPPPQY